LPTAGAILSNIIDTMEESIMAKSGDEGWKNWVLGSLPKMEADMTQTAGFTPAPTTTVTAQATFSAGMHLQPQFDPLEILPPGAAERLRKLRQRAADAHALIPEFEAIREASMAKTEAANALKRLTDHPQDGGFGLKPDSHRQVTEAQRTLDKATDDFERVKQRSADRTAAWQAASGALANVETWLRHGKPSGVQLLDQDGEPPKLNKGESVTDAISRLQRRGRELRADLHRLASAPYPSSYCKQRMAAQIEALAQRGAPDVTLLIEHDGELIWPMTHLRAQMFGAESALAVTEAADAIALTCWLHKSALIAALDREIATEADDKAALSVEARQVAASEAEADLLQVERDECFFVWRAIDERLPAEHRADVDQRALLSITLVTVPRATEAPGTSPEHGYNLIGGRRR
jgi:hypothetical protein